MTSQRENDDLATFQAYAKTAYFEFPPPLSNPAVSQCVVIGVPDLLWGERVHAVVVLRSGAVLTHEQLREHCRHYIAGYKLPRSSEWRATLPLSEAGKILKRTLREEFLAATK